MFLLFCLLLLGLFISARIDKKFNWMTKNYLIIAIVQLIFIWTASDPVREWQIESSYLKARPIIEKLNAFKLKFGRYPVTLSDLEEKIHQTIPRRTNIGTCYRYAVNNSSDYDLQFISYYGYVAHYDKHGDEWRLAD
jgi:hypothetical protein